MHPQTLRQYDRLGLVCPGAPGQSRRYSMRDVVQLREIGRLGSEGVSLEGIRRVLDLENETRALLDRVRELETALADELINRPGAPCLRGDGHRRGGLVARRRPSAAQHADRALATAELSDTSAM